MKKIISVLILILILFSSCSSFPERQSSDDAMLLIPIVLDKSNPGNVFGSKRATIEDQSGNVMGSLMLTTSADYKYIQLPPGEYKIKQTTFIYSDTGKKGSSNVENIYFELFPGKITVLNKYMLYDFYTDIHKPNYYYMRGRFINLTPDMKAKVEEDLSEEEAAASWEIVFPGLY